MKIAVIGATGTAGRKVVEHINAAGHEAVEISRSTGVDITTGEGLEAALAGAEVAIDASSPWPAEGEDIGEFLSGVMRRVVEAWKSAGLKHIVYLSITNIDKPEVAKFDYYRAKALQETGHAAHLLQLVRVLRVDEGREPARLEKEWTRVDFCVLGEVEDGARVLLLLVTAACLRCMRVISLRTLDVRRAVVVSVGRGHDCAAVSTGMLRRKRL